jgi:hypothetical protein
VPGMFIANSVDEQQAAMAVAPKPLPQGLRLHGRPRTTGLLTGSKCRRRQMARSPSRMAATRSPRHTEDYQATPKKCGVPTPSDPTMSEVCLQEYLSVHTIPDSSVPRTDLPRRTVEVNLLTVGIDR